MEPTCQLTPSRERLVELLAMMQIPVRELLRRKGTPYDELRLDDPALSNHQLIDAMMAHPILINRPIVVTAKGARLCRPAELVMDLLERMRGIQLAEHPVHLGLGATAESQPPFTGGMEWYASYAQRHAADGAEGRLVSMYTFAEPWDSWEMHPSGSEVVLCTAGVIVLHQELADGSRRKVTLAAGDYAINPPGVWHTADVETTATAVFITAGLGTEHRPR